MHIRRAHQLFPIRPYLSLLVATLEDGDARVRECARESVVELFTGPGVSDAARADLKVAMAKRNVRKAIVDAILSRLVLGGTAVAANLHQTDGSENGDIGEKGKDYVPPSLVLQSRKQTAGSASGPSGILRSESTREFSRPPSRTATVPPADGAGTTVADVHPVYVRSQLFKKTMFLFAFQRTDHFQP